MVSESQPAPENSALLTSASGLTYEGIKAHFPHVLDVRAKKADDFDPQNTSVAEWFTTESTDLADPSTLPRIIGRVYFLKYGTTIETFDIKQQIKRSLNESAEKPIPLKSL